jgi:hypothetical protein
LQHLFKISRVTLGGCLTFLAVAAAGPALGAPEIQATASFAVARDPSAQKAAAIVDAALKARIVRLETLRLIEPARVLSGDPRTREEETLERARAALADGRRAYDALVLDEAIARLGQSVSLYQETGPLLGDLEELQTALAYLGAALTLRGSADEAESTFVELLTVNASYQPDGFPPTVTKVFERATKKIETTAAGSVEVYSTPPYAAVYVDGRFEGVTPLTLTDLLSGTHYLRLEKIGFTTHGAPLEVAPNQRITSQTRLAGIKRGAELRDLAARAAEEVPVDGMGGSLRSLTRQLVADTLVFVAVSQSGSDATLVGGVFDGATGTRLVTERVVLGVEKATFQADLDQYVSRLLSVISKEATPTGGNNGQTGGAFGLSTAPPPPPAANGQSSGFRASTPPPPTGTVPSTTATPETSGEVYLGWTMIGVGAASTITGVVFAILAKNAHSDYLKTSQLSPDLQDIRDTGKTDALVTDITLIGGGALVAGGVVILLIANSRDPTPDELLRPRAAVVPLDNGALVTVGGGF